MLTLQAASTQQHEDCIQQWYLTVVNCRCFELQRGECKLASICLPSIGVSRGSAMAASSPTVSARPPIRTNVLPL